MQGKRCSQLHRFTLYSSKAPKFSTFQHFHFSTFQLSTFQLLNFCYFFIFFFILYTYIYIYKEFNSIEPTLLRKNPQIPIMEIFGGEFFYYEIEQSIQVPFAGIR